MSRQIQIRRGSATEHETFIGAIGEITMDTTNKTLRVHDGETAGGTILARQSELDKFNHYMIPDYENVVQNINNAPAEYLATENCLVCVRGDQLSYDLYKDDVCLVIEFALSTNYNTSWQLVPQGYTLKRRATSQYANFIIVKVGAM